MQHRQGYGCAGVEIIKVGTCRWKGCSCTVSPGGCGASGRSPACSSFIRPCMHAWQHSAIPHLHPGHQQAAGNGCMLHRWQAVAAGGKRTGIVHTALDSFRLQAFMSSSITCKS